MKSIEDINIRFIAESEDKESAAEIIAEDIMQKHGRKKNGYWDAASKNLMALVLFYIATSEKVKDEDRNMYGAKKTISMPEQFSDTVHETILADQGKSPYTKYYMTWIANPHSGDIAANVYAILDKYTE